MRSLFVLSEIIISVILQIQNSNLLLMSPNLRTQNGNWNLPGHNILNRTDHTAMQRPDPGNTPVIYE